MLTAESVVVVIIDFQEKLAAAMSNRDDTQANLCRLAAGMKALGAPLIITEQYPDKLGATIPEVADAGDPLVIIPKTTFSCCGNATFTEALKRIHPRNVVLAGIEAHVCVYQTAMHLQDSRYRVHVVADAVTSRSPQNTTIAMDRVRDEGVRVVSTEMLLFEMLPEACGPTFKEILGIVK